MDGGQWFSPHFLVIDRDNPTSAEMNLLACEEPRVFFSIDTLKVSPNYVLDVDTETICAMPLGFVRAELPTGSGAICDARVNSSYEIKFIGCDSYVKFFRVDVPLFTDEPEKVSALFHYVNWWHKKPCR